MDQHEKRQLENQLMTMGLAGLKSPELLEQLGILISAFPGDRHRFFEDLLGQCDSDKRYEMYEAMAPKLHFKALPLSDYQARINNRASEMVSLRRMRVEGKKPEPIEVDGQKFYGVPEQLSDYAMATLTCHKCKCVDRFVSSTPARAMGNAREVGWKRDPALNKEICPKCSKVNILDIARKAVAVA